MFAPSWRQRHFLCFIGVLSMRLVSCIQQQQVFKSSINFDVAWIEKDASYTTDLTVPTIFSFESATAAFFSNQLKSEEDEGVLFGQKVVMTTVHVREHSIDKGTGTTSSPDFIVLLRSSLSIIYTGIEKMSDEDALLNQMFAESDRQEQAIKLMKETGVIPLKMDVSAVSVSFSMSAPADVLVTLINFDDQHNSTRSGSNKALIVACTFVSLALVLVSVILIWVVGGCENWKSSYRKRRKGRGSDSDRRLAKSRTWSYDEDIDHVTSASGIIGANPNYDMENKPPAKSSGVEMTPHRGVYRETVSPLSQITSSTNQTEMEASLPPLGIRSLRKLARHGTPDKQLSTNPYHASRLSYS